MHKIIIWLFVTVSFTSYAEIRNVPDNFETIQEAITASNATIDWAATPWLVDNYIYIATGEYAEALTPAYSCTIIGMGVLGTDTAAEIHPAAGSALSGTGLGLRLRNLWLEAETAVPVINFGICNNTEILGCNIVMGIAGLATMGIYTTNASHLTVKGCHFDSGVADLPYGIYALGGADKYFHACRIEDNIIRATTAGIYIAADCTASGTSIRRNTIVRPVKGIDDNNGNTWCTENYISASTDAIEHANSSSKCIGNHVINNVTGAMEHSGT